MSFTAATIIELQARLRLACAALSAVTGNEVRPEDVDLSALHPTERARLLALGVDDYWKLLGSPPSAVVEEVAKAVP